MTSPIDIVKSFYDALGRGDASAALGLLSPDMEWNVVAGWPYKPTGRGPKGVAEGVLKPVFKEWRDYALHGSDLLVAGRQGGVHGPDDRRPHGHRQAA